MNFMKANEKELELVLTYKCNWDCTYCCVDTHNQNNITKIQIQEKIDYIKENYSDYNITLSGGEIGLMPYTEIVDIIKQFKNFNLSLNTNGLFLQKYPELISEFDHILYHCSPEMKDRNVQLNLPDNVEYMLVITDENLINLETFIIEYSNIRFHMVPASNPEGMNKPTLSTKNKRYVLKKYRHNATIESQLRLITEKDFDQIVYL